MLVRGPVVQRPVAPQRLQAPQYPCDAKAHAAIGVRAHINVADMRVVEHDLCCAAQMEQATGREVGSQ